MAILEGTENRNNQAFSTVGFAAGTLQRCNAKRRPRSVSVAESGIERRGPAFSKIARWRFTFNGHVEIASEDDSAKLRAQVADEQQERDPNRPPLGALVADVDVGDCEVGATTARAPCGTCQ